MNPEFKVGDRIQARHPDNDNWTTAEVVEVDPNDDDQTYKVLFLKDHVTHWVKNHKIRSIDLLKLLFEDQKITSVGKCPICGQSGRLSFNMFKCNNAECNNYYNKD